MSDKRVVNLATEKIIRLTELPLYGVRWSRSHLDRLERAGQFPRRVALGARRVGWLEREIINYQKMLVAQRARELGVLGSRQQKRREGD